MLDGIEASIWRLSWIGDLEQTFEDDEQSLLTLPASSRVCFLH